jgi:hypothetical protein
MDITTTGSTGGPHQCWTTVSQDTDYAVKKKEALNSTHPNTTDRTDPITISTTGNIVDSPQCWTMIAKDTSYAIKKKAVLNSKEPNTTDGTHRPRIRKATKVCIPAQLGT